MQLRTYGLHVIIIAKRIVGFIIAIRAVYIEYFIGNISDGCIYGFKCGIIVLIKIIAFLLVYYIMIRRNNLNSFIGEIVISFIGKKLHYFYRSLVKTFIYKYVSLSCIITVNNHANRTPH